MRDLAKNILFKELEKSGYQFVLFNEETPNKTNGIIECVIDAMEKFNKISKTQSTNKTTFFCRLYVKRKSCQLFKVNKDACRTCVHFTELDKK